jgi:VanZ family protein
MPVDELPAITLDIWDKAQHATGFCALAVLGLWAYPKHFARVCIGLLLFGVAIEVAQSASGWRTGDLFDWVADAVGIALAAMGARLKTRSYR